MKDRVDKGRDSRPAAAVAPLARDFNKDANRDGGAEGARGIGLAPPPSGIGFIDQGLQAAGRAGLPPNLRSGIEAMSGLSMADVRVHRDSSRPAQLNALAYAQGADIFLAPGQERQLPHEAWHVVQQKQGRVRATAQARMEAGAAGGNPAGPVALNDDPALEREADTMGARAQQATDGQTGGGTEDLREARGPEAGPVQRKVGFEFEDSSWRPWKMGYFSRIYPAERKAALHRGTGFQLEADDTPGPKQSNLEFVTNAFEASDEGLAALQVSLAEITALVRNRLDPLVGRAGPENPQAAPPYVYAADRFVAQGAHGFTGPAYGNGRWTYLSGGTAGMRLKMQVTAGVSLADLPQVMKYFGSQVPGESAGEKIERDPARALLSGNADAAAANSIQRVIGSAPDVALDALLRIEADGRLTGPEQLAFADAASADLKGLLAALMLTMKMLQLPVANVVKYRVPLMFRTHFAALFALLPEAQRAALTRVPAVLTDSMVAASNHRPLMRRVQAIDPDTGLTDASPLIRPPRRPAQQPNTPMPHEVLASITLGAWFTGLTRGVDLLTPTAVDAWLKTQGYWWFSRKPGAELVDSFGSIPQADRAPGLGRHLAVFENRAISPQGTGVELNVEDAARVAWNQLLFYKQIEDMHDWDTPVGAYPQKATGTP